jgi:hypothetical protein
MAFGEAAAMLVQLGVGVVEAGAVSATRTGHHKQLHLVHLVLYLQPSLATTSNCLV